MLPENYQPLEATKQKALIAAKEAFIPTMRELVRAYQIFYTLFISRIQTQH